MGKRRVEEGARRLIVYPERMLKPVMFGQVVVCVVADGRLKIDPRTRSVLAALGVYQDGVGKNVVNGKPVVRDRLDKLLRYADATQTAHLYEYTTQRKSPCMACMQHCFDA